MVILSAPLPVGEAVHKASAVSYKPTALNYTFSDAFNTYLNEPTAYSKGIPFGNMIKNPSFETGDSSFWDPSGPTSLTKYTASAPTYGWGSSLSGSYADTQSSDNIYHVSQSSKYQNGTPVNPSTAASPPAYSQGSSYSGTYSETTIADDSYHISDSLSYDANPGSVGPNTASTCEDNASTGTITWENPLNAKTDDGSYATAVGDETLPLYSHYLMWTGFGFSIPDGKQIKGILLEIEGQATSLGKVRDITVRLVKDGALVGDSKANVYYWDTAWTVRGYGGSSDLWGTAWSETDVEKAGFGCVLGIRIVERAPPALARVDFARITIYYRDYVAYRIDYYYTFSFLAAPRDEITQIEFVYEGKHDQSMLGIEIHVYVYKYQTGWTDTGDDVHYSEGQDNYVTTDINYLSASGEMRIRYSTETQTTPLNFKNYVDYLTCIVTYRTYANHLDYSYAFQFTESQKSNVDSLAWYAEGQTLNYSVPIYIYDWSTSSWFSTGADLTTSENPSSQAGLDTRYMDSAGNMRIRFMLDAKPYGDNILVDQMYWLVLYTNPLELETASVYHGSFSGKFTGPSQRYQVTSSISLRGNMTFYAALRAGTVPTAPDYMGIQIKVGGSSTDWLRYYISSSEISDSGDTLNFRVGSETDTWYYIRRNVTADLLFKSASVASRAILMVNITQSSLTGHDAFFDSLFLFYDKVMSGHSNGLNGNPQFEDPRNAGSDSTNNFYPIGWGGGEGANAGESSFQWSDSYLHYYSVQLSTTPLNGAYKTIYYDLGTSPQSYLAFALKEVAGSSDNNLLEVTVSDTTDNRQLTYEFSTGSNAVRTENETRQIIHSRIPLDRWIYRIANWTRDWAHPDQYGIKPDSSHNWRVTLRISNCETISSVTGRFDAIWMGSSNTPSYDRLLFGDIRRSGPDDYSGLNDDLAHDTIGFDGGGLFIHESDTGSDETHRSSVCLAASFQGYNIRKISWKESINMISYAGVNIKLWVNLRNGTETGYSGEVNRLVWKDSSDLFGQATIDQNVSYLGSTNVMIRFLDNLTTGEFYWSISWISMFEYDSLPPGTPELLTPTQDMHVSESEPVTFEWTPAADNGGSGVNLYQLQVFNASDLYGSAETHNLTATSTSIPIDLEPGRYWWRVRAMDNAGLLGAWNTSKSFDLLLYVNGPDDGGVYIILIVATGAAIVTVLGTSLHLSRARKRRRATSDGEGADAPGAISAATSDSSYRQTHGGARQTQKTGLKLLSSISSLACMRFDLERGVELELLRERSDSKFLNYLREDTTRCTNYFDAAKNSRGTLSVFEKGEHIIFIPCGYGTAPTGARYLKNVLILSTRKELRKREVEEIRSELIKSAHDNEMLDRILSKVRNHSREKPGTTG